MSETITYFKTTDVYMKSLFTKKGFCPPQWQGSLAIRQGKSMFIRVIQDSVVLDRNYQTTIIAFIDKYGQGLSKFLDDESQVYLDLVKEHCRSITESQFKLLLI